MNLPSFENTHKSGYLYQDFRLFHITDQCDRSFEFHYHEFNKIIIFLSGNVTYDIEGQSYQLKPWDLLLINHHEVHKPIIDPGETYDRIIIWVTNEFLTQCSQPDCNLATCFELARSKSFSLIRLEAALQTQLQSLITRLDQSFNSNEFGADLLTHALFLELLIYLNRIHINNHYIYDSSSSEYDDQIVQILAYIKDNLAGDLSVERIASEFFVSKHYLMHKFKSKTGYTLHNYILNKRLFLAVEYIKTGTSITEAAALCGFSDYSTFLRAFRKTFHSSPREFFQTMSPVVDETT